MLSHRSISASHCLFTGIGSQGGESQSTKRLEFAGPRRRVDDASMRFMHVVGMATAILFTATVVPTGTSPAHADTHAYLRCIKSDAELPAGAEAKDLPSVSFIEAQINAGKSRAQVAQELVGYGIKPDDAALQVQCVMANWPIGTS